MVTTTTSENIKNSSSVGRFNGVPKNEFSVKERLFLKPQNFALRQKTWRQLNRYPQRKANIFKTLHQPMRAILALDSMPLLCHNGKDVSLTLTPCYKKILRVHALSLKLK